MTTAATAQSAPTTTTSANTGGSNGNTGPNVTPMAGSTTGGTGTGVANPGTGGSANGSSVSDWTSSLAPEVLGYVQNKGFKTPVDIIDSYKNLEKAIGAPKDRVVLLPEKADDVEGWNGAYAKLGRPAKADDYDIKPVEGQPDTMAKWARDTFYDIGLSKTQAEKLATKWNENMAAQQAVQKEEAVRTSQQQEANLKKEWGAAHEQNLIIARKAAVEFGLGAEQVDQLQKALGFDGVMKLMHNIGSRIGESSYVGRNPNATGGQNAFGILTPGQAQARLAERRADNAFVQRYTSGDVAAKKEMEELHKMAYPD